LAKVEVAELETILSVNACKPPPKVEVAVLVEYILPAIDRVAEGLDVPMPTLP